MTLFTEIILALVIITFLAWLYKIKQKNKEFYDRFPSPPGYPLFGNSLDFGSTKEMLNVMMRYIKECGGIVSVQAGPRKMLLVSDYKFLETILSSSKVLNKSVEYNFFRSWLGTGLLTSDGPKWKKHRRVLTPAFHFQILEQFIEIFEKEGGKLVQKLEKEVGKKSVDVYPYVTLCTLDIICETAMGTSINAQDFENSEYVRSVKEMCRIIIERTFSLLGMFSVTYPLTKNYYTEKHVLNILHQHTSSVINQRRQERKRTGTHQSEENSEFKRKKAFLDLILDATVDGRPLTDEEIREEVDTFMFEGHDTTSSAISFALFCLANHPEVQAKALKEQKELFGNEANPSPTYTDLQGMKYLEQVIKETLRLYPSVPFFGRETTEPVDYNGIPVPPGVQMTLFAYGIHRDPEYFKDPETFNPERFGDVDGKLPYAFIPFSAGPRNCIGQKFAMLELKSTISKIIRKFELIPATPQHNLQLAPETVLKSINGIKISLKKRN